MTLPIDALESITIFGITFFSSRQKPVVIRQDKIHLRVYEQKSSVLHLLTPVFVEFQNGLARVEAAAPYRRDGP